MLTKVDVHTCNQKHTRYQKYYEYPFSSWAQVMAKTPQKTQEAIGNSCRKSVPCARSVHL